uniref:Metallophos domain-containing protein n=1 Tax=Syphacia muris TaxID=451379 RepID=A0A0N5AEU8_9BILA
MVSVDELCCDPDTLWSKYESEGRISKKCDLMRKYENTVEVRLDTPLRSDAIRIVCISDIHDTIGSWYKRIPNGDVLLCAGDLTQNGSKERELPHKHKIIIAGNHDLGFQDNFNLKEEEKDPSCRGKEGTAEGYKLLTNCIYLQDKAVTALFFASHLLKKSYANYASFQIFGLKIYGSSWHPLPGFPFSLRRGQELLNKWNLIPTDTDILITHTPPLGHNDVYNVTNGRWGCSELLNTVEKRVHPKFHVFGHVHEKNGMTTNGETFFVNASICNHKLEPVNDPIIFDIPKAN